MIEKVRDSWETDKLYTAMLACWLATVFASFFGSYLLPITVPIIGTLFAFRILLPVTFVLYVIWAVRNRKPFWRGISTLEKWCDIFGAVLLLYGAISLFRAIEFMWTFRRLFNLTFDLLFFWMTMRMLCIPTVRKWTMNVCGIMLGLLIVLGLYEVFFGGIVDPAYDEIKRVYIFNEIFQYPIVFSGNTNNYAATLIFLFAALLLWWLQPGKMLERGKAIVIGVLGVLCYTMPLVSNARLCEVSILILLSGILIYLFIAKKKGRILIAAILVVGILFVEFTNRYHYLMPQIQTYMHAMQTGQTEPSGTEDSDTITSPPTFQLSDPEHASLQDQFFETDETTGETVLRSEGSAGVRTRLLIHAGQCFVESYGLGVGLGNTELLARDRAIISGEKSVWNIHCFVARIVADYGIFVLIPLSMIVLLLLKKTFAYIVQSIRKKKRVEVGYGVLALWILMVYPFLSTAPSDAQDLLSMWLYLAVVVVMFQQFSKNEEEIATQ